MKPRTLTITIEVETGLSVKQIAGARALTLYDARGDLVTTLMLTERPKVNVIRATKTRKGKK